MKCRIITASILPPLPIHVEVKDPQSFLSLHWEESEKDDCIAGKRGYCNSVMESNLSFVSRPCRLSHNQFPSCWQGLFSFPLCVHSQSIFTYFLSTSSHIAFVRRNRERKSCGGHQTLYHFTQVPVRQDSCLLFDMAFCQSSA